jgi:hypothetical protein
MTSLATIIRPLMIEQDVLFTYIYPKSLEMQLGDKGAKLHELSLLSDCGSRVQSTTLQFQG